MLVAVMVAVAAETGAVKSPVELIAPTLADHVTDELKLPVPCTFALHCDVPPPAIVTGLQVTDTDETDGDGVGCGCVVIIPLPPQAIIQPRIEARVQARMQARAERARVLPWT